MFERSSLRPATGQIVVGVDGSLAGDSAVRWAAASAARRGRTLRLVHALDLVAARGLLGGSDVLEPSVLDGLRARGAAFLTDADELARSVERDLAVELDLIDDEPGRVLLALSRSADAVVLGVDPGAGAVAHLGSTLLKVVAHGHGSVIVVRGGSLGHSKDGGEPVVVGVDGGQSCAPALRAAFAEARERHTELVAVHCWADLPYGRLPRTVAVEDDDIDAAARTVLAEQLDPWIARFPDVRVHRETHPSGPAHHLLHRSGSAQLVVVGSRGRGGFAGLLLGSTGNTLVQHARCPVLVAHPR
ncbi:universal stress protein [Nocardia jiangsuensis]|uniref:Universal stress protein n=1 Tax=Nocardia jiangsuensis TaxID=1691563 RepID=A0ABV8DNF8_9NOCA